MTKKPAKQSSAANIESPPHLDFSLDALRGELAEPSPGMVQAVNRAIEQIRTGAPMVHIKGETEHQCQVQLVPLFTESAIAAGLEVKDTGLGRLRVGNSEVVFDPLYLARPD